MLGNEGGVRGLRQRRIDGHWAMLKQTHSEQRRGENGRTKKSRPAEAIYTSQTEAQNLTTASTARELSLGGQKINNLVHWSNLTSWPLSGMPIQMLNRHQDAKHHGVS